jgi:hypothetical protein
VLLALTATDVAFVGALAAVVSAIAAPLSAWVVARSTSSSSADQTREERFYGDHS